MECSLTFAHRGDRIGSEISIAPRAPHARRAGGSEGPKREDTGETLTGTQPQVQWVGKSVEEHNPGMWANGIPRAVSLGPATARLPLVYIGRRWASSVILNPTQLAEVDDAELMSRMVHYRRTLRYNSDERLLLDHWHMSQSIPLQDFVALATTTVSPTRESQYRITNYWKIRFAFICLV